MWESKAISRHLPLATGPFVPGCMDIMLGYGKNSLFVRLFYATKAKRDRMENSKKWIRWLANQNYLRGMSKVIMIHIQVLRFIFWWFGTYYIPVLYGEKAQVEENTKCIVMSHGLGGCRFLYSNTCYNLASNGFLVVCLEHRDSSACYTYYYSNKTDAQAEKPTSIEFKHVPLGENHYKERNTHIKFRSDECCRTLDFLKKLNEGDIPFNVLLDVPSHTPCDFQLKDFVGKLDLSNLTMMGHSFGGATALYTMAQRIELKQCILLDPWMFPIKDEKLDALRDRSLLFINTETFHIESNVKAMSKFLLNDNQKMYTILRTTHENQTDSVLMVGYWLNWFMRKINPYVALQINNSIILNYLHDRMSYPTDVTQYVKYLEDNPHFHIGLTKPWA